MSLTFTLRTIQSACLVHCMQDYPTMSQPAEGASASQQSRLSTYSTDINSLASHTPQWNPIWQRQHKHKEVPGRPPRYPIYPSFYEGFKPSWAEGDWKETRKMAYNVQLKIANLQCPKWRFTGFSLIGNKLMTFIPFSFTQNNSVPKLKTKTTNFNVKMRGKVSEYWSGQQGSVYHGEWVVWCADELSTFYFRL